MRMPLKEHTTFLPAASGLLFIGLNVADGWLTERLLALGGNEWNLFSVFYPTLIAGDQSYNLVIVKGFLALLVVAVLIRFGKSKLLWLLNVGISIVVLSNAICFLAYLSSRYNWL